MFLRMNEIAFEKNLSIVFFFLYCCIGLIYSEQQTGQLAALLVKTGVALNDNILNSQLF